jgi:hypothetical protein
MKASWRTDTLRCAEKNPGKRNLSGWPEIRAASKEKVGYLIRSVPAGHLFPLETEANCQDFASSYFNN